MRPLHLICNAHIDPSWLWEWEEGAAEAMSTFRTAADLIEEFDGFVFNHNEVILYQWVQEYEPALFRRIQRLVAEGRWHIMGGWYVQPDCNMPSGESFVRQMLVGREYFRKHFGVTPTTAINFDPFGHTRGLVQLLAKAGYDSYLFMRPQQTDLDPLGFVWVGFDGSEVIGHRMWGGYGSARGQARARVEQWLKEQGDTPFAGILWGVGNHGGGPSRGDLRDLAALMAERDDEAIQHSTPEAFFAELHAVREDLPRVETDLNPWAVGCYTSQVRIKQLHRELENLIYVTEKMASNAALQGLMDYPKAELDSALQDLLTCEFHDILPGSSIQAVEEEGLRRLSRGLMTAGELRARSFFALASGQAKGGEGDVPILVYNPHPYPVKAVVACEYNLPDSNWDPSFWTVSHLTQNGVRVPAQMEKEASSINLDWRKRVVFLADLAPSQMSRFDCVFERVPELPRPALTAEAGRFTVKNDRLTVAIGAETGLIEQFSVDGVDYLQSGAGQALVMRDNEDAWGMNVTAYRDLAGRFALATPERSAVLSGLHDMTLPPVRVVEEGAVRTVIEAVFEYGDSALVQTYRIPRDGVEVEVEIRAFWNEKDHMLKWSLPTTLAAGDYIGQTAYGRQPLPNNGEEAVSQKWCALVSSEQAVTVSNAGTYGSDCTDGEIRLSLMRSPAYSGHPIGDRPIVRQDRFTPRIDQGERIFRFWLAAGATHERLADVEFEAQCHNERPYALSFCPSGQGKAAVSGLVISDPLIQLGAFKQAEDGNGFVCRLFEPTGTARAAVVTVPALGIEASVELGAYEVKTYRIEPTTGTLCEAPLMEWEI